jgi:hypothetical protein
MHESGLSQNKNREKNQKMRKFRKIIEKSRKTKGK